MMDTFKSIAGDQHRMCFDDIKAPMEGVEIFVFNPEKANNQIKTSDPILTKETSPKKVVQGNLQ